MGSFSIPTHIPSYRYNWMLHVFDFTYYTNITCNLFFSSFVIFIIFNVKFFFFFVPSLSIYNWIMTFVHYHLGVLCVKWINKTIIPICPPCRLCHDRISEGIQGLWTHLKMFWNLNCHILVPTYKKVWTYSSHYIYLKQNKKSEHFPENELWKWSININ